MTDNRTRTVADVRHALSKHGGNLGTDGSVAFMFKHCGQFIFSPEYTEDQIMEVALEAGAQDVQYFNMANAKVPAQLLANQSTSGVDAVSGATKSSNAIKKAFYYAYKSAKK